MAFFPGPDRPGENEGAKAGGLRDPIRDGTRLHWWDGSLARPHSATSRISTFAAEQETPDPAPRVKCRRLCDGEVRCIGSVDYRGSKVANKMLPSGPGSRFRSSYIPYPEKSRSAIGPGGAEAPDFPLVCKKVQNACAAWPLPLNLLN